MSRKNFSSLSTIAAFLFAAIVSILLLTSSQYDSHSYDDLNDIQIYFVDTNESEVKQEKVRSLLPRDLPKEYRSCITELVINTTCQFTFNSSFKVLGLLGRGSVAMVYSVLFDDDTLFALKYNFGKTNAVRSEYDFLYHLKIHCLRLRIELNVPWLHPLYPPYYYFRKNAKNEKRKIRCFIFVKQLKNAITWTQMEQIELHQMHLSILQTHQNIFNFFLKGYEDIMKIFYECNKLYKYHNDFHEGNILISRNDHSFHLIDFGDLFVDDAYNWFNQKANAEFKCVPHTCPPTTWLYLQSVEKRNEFRKQYNNDSKHAMEKLSEYARYSKKYELVSILFHSFIHFYCIKRQDNGQYFYDETSNGQMCDDLLAKNEQMRWLRSAKNRKDVVYDDDLYNNRWCLRLDMIQTFEKYTNTQNLQHEFWQLMKIFDDDRLYLNPCTY